MPVIYDPPRPVGTPSPVAGHHPGRATEESDARMAIRHDEEKSGKKKQDAPDHELALPEDVYDQTTLSIRALIDFLKKFLQGLDAQPLAGKGPSSSDLKGTETRPSNLPPAAALPLNPVAAAAAQAYGRTAHVRRDFTPDTQTAELLGAAQVREIHILLDKLTRLDQNKVAGLKLYRAESFVQSLMNAADLALADLPSQP